MIAQQNFGILAWSLAYSGITHLENVNITYEQE